MENPATGGAPDRQACRRDAPEYTRSPHDSQPLAGPRFDPELVRAVGADRFPPMPLGVVR